MNLETLTDQDPTTHDLPNQEPTTPSPTDQDPTTHDLPNQEPTTPSPTDQDPTAHDLPNQEPTTPSPADQDLSDQSPTDPSMDEYLENGYGYEVPKRGDIRIGEIIDINDYGLVVDINFKREGFVPAEDLTRLDEETRSEIKVGIRIPLFVLRPENREGHPILSIHQARLYQDWIQAEQMMASSELYEGEVTGHNRGGLIVKFGKIRGFVPALQIVGLPKRLKEEQRRERMEAMIGDQLGLKIIEVDRQRRRLIFSQRRALRSWQEMQRNRVMSELVEGETRHGKVTSITNFGAFVDLGGADGLIHVSELSWSRVDNPRQVLKVGDKLDVYVLNVDQERKRIALSLKKLQPDPWTIVDDHYQAGQLVEGRVTRVLDFGAFVELDMGIEGLLHASEMIGTPELAPSDIIHSGEKLLVKIIRIDSRRRRLALSARQVSKGEWERWVAEQQASPEPQEAEATVSKAVEEEAEATETEAEISEVTEAETQAKVAVSEAAEEEATALETEAETEAGEVAEAPKAEAVIGEAVEEAATVSEAATEADEVAEAPEAEAVVSEAIEEAATVSETEAETEAGEVAEAPEAEAVVSEAIEEAAAVSEIEAAC